MWNDIDFLRKEVARLERLLAGRHENNRDCEELQYDLGNFWKELEEQESKLWNALSRSSS